jgi:nucleoside-diphosphate-sugar epimerase
MANRGLFWMVAPPGTPFTMIYVGDLADGVALAAEDARCAGQTLFLGHPLPVTVDDIFRNLARACDRPYQPRHIPAWALRGLARAGDLAWRLGRAPLVDSSRLVEFQAEGFVCAVDRARDAIGFTASTALPEGFDRTLRWYRERGSV